MTTMTTMTMHYAGSLLNQVRLFVADQARDNEAYEKLASCWGDKEYIKLIGKSRSLKAVLVKLEALTISNKRLWLATENLRAKKQAKDEAKQVAVDYAYRCHSVLLGTTLHSCFIEYLDNKFLYSQYSEQYTQFSIIVDVYNKRLADNLLIIASSKNV